MYCALLYFQNLKALYCHNATNNNKYYYFITPQENSLLYQIFYKEIQMLRKDDLIFQLPVLSDEGKGLIKFCTDNVIMTFD